MEVTLPTTDPMPPPEHADASVSSSRHGSPALAPAPDVDPTVRLLIEEVRRGQDRVVEEVRGLRTEMGALRAQAPGRLAVYALGVVYSIALIAVLALVASRGVDPSVVAGAVHQVAPGAP